MKVLREACSSSKETPPILETVRFYMPPESVREEGEIRWTNFSAVLFPENLWKSAMGVWRDFGTGVSTRHAEFCLDNLRYLDADSSNANLRSPAPCKRALNEPGFDFRQAATDMAEVKSLIGRLVTSEQPGQITVRPDDVFVYPNGMNAIYAATEALAMLDAAVVAYG